MTDPPGKSKAPRKRAAGRIAAVCVVAALLVWLIVNEWTLHRAVRRGQGQGRGGPGGLATYVRRPRRIMGTQTVLKAVVPQGHGDQADAAVRQAEAVLRDVEARMSTWIEGTEVWRLNAAPAGEVVKLSAATRQVLELSRGLAAQTHRAFDVTCRPILELWKQAAKRKRLPTPDEIKAARSVSGWDKLELLDGAARKTADGAGVDLGGVAKGYAIDRAVDALRAAGAVGGIVDVGGDVCCFGKRAGGGKWKIGVRDPFRTDRLFTELAVAEGAVCTSGNYFRFVEIDGRRYSHIVDPRSGQSARAAPSVTVFARTAAVADAWATALSVLGPEGLERLPARDGLEAMVIVGTPHRNTVHMTPGFQKLLARRLAQPPVIVARRAARPATRPAAQGTPAPRPAKGTTRPLAPPAQPASPQEN